MDGSKFSQASLLRKEHFHLNRNALIFGRMEDLHKRGEPIDRLTVLNELERFGEAAEAGGLTYLVDLDAGIPDVKSIAHWVQIIKEKAALRKLVFNSRKVMNLAMSEEHSAATIIRDLSRGLTRMEMKLDQRQTSVTPLEILNEHGGLEGFIGHAIKPGISTGFPQIDEAMMGLQEGCHYVIGGATGSGKTTLAENIAINVARNKFPVSIFSLEMSKEILLARSLCSLAQVPFKAYIRNDMMPSQRVAIKQAAAELAELPVHIDDFAGLTITELSSRLDRHVAEFGTRLYVVDYLQIVQADPEMKIRTAYDRVTAASTLCRMMARKHGISSIALSQLARPSDKKKNDRPTINDLKETGNIENDAAAVMLIWREELGKPGDANTRGKAECIFAKSRVGGQKTVHLEFIGKFYRFVDHGQQEAPEVDD
jgi:replicative DNA helicase